MRKRADNEFQEESQDIRATKLVEICGIPMNWAQRTIAKFPDLREALLVTRGYSNMPPGRYSSYFEYLSNVQARVLDASSPSLYEQEVAERTAMINQDFLAQQDYRNSPSKARDYWEQQTTRRLDA